MEYPATAEEEDFFNEMQSQQSEVQEEMRAGTIKKGDVFS